MDINICIHLLAALSNDKNEDGDDYNYFSYIFIVHKDSR